MSKILELWAKVIGRCERAKFLGPLLVRICLGVLFAQSGWGKLHNIERTTAFFASLHIPAPGIQAVFVSLVELVGGAFVLVGFATRIASLFLAGTMVVALMTAVEFEGFLGLLTASETINLVALLWLMVAGAGAASIDAILARKLKRI